MSIFDFANQQMRQGGNFNQLGGLTFANTGSIMDGMGQYANPYEDEVINRTQMDIARQNQIQQQGNRAAAASSGAFGGSRHGVVEALTNEASQRTMADTSAGMRRQGFMDAAGLANQDIGNRFAAGSGLLQAGQGAAGIGTTGFNMGQAINQDMSQQGMLQQLLQQQVLDQGSGMFQGFASQPLNLLNMRSAAASGSPLNAAVTQSTTNTSNPGLLGFLSAGAGLMSGMGKAGKK